MSSSKKSPKKNLQRIRRSKEKGSDSGDGSDSDGGSDGDSDDSDPSDDNSSDSDNESDSDSNKRSRKTSRKPTYGKRPSIHTFDGGDASVATFWLRSFINATDTMDWTNVDKAKNFSSYLTGSAQKWYINEFGLNRKQSMRDFRNKLSGQNC